jgi:hypothetical protein
MEKISMYKDALQDHANNTINKTNPTAKVEFTISEGKRFAKIIEYRWGNGSVFAFVDKQNGDIWKPASWSKPQPNGVRGNVNSPENWPLEIGQFYIRK